MARFKPQASYSISHTEAIRRGLKSNYITEKFNTYRELLKALPDLRLKSINDKIEVSRSRRGEWGEWFELWEFGNKVGEGWM